MPPLTTSPSFLRLPFLLPRFTCLHSQIRLLTLPSKQYRPIFRFRSPRPPHPSSLISRGFSTSRPHLTTLMQVLRKARQPQRARHPVSPALVNRPQMKAVCVRVSVMKPKKPNSGERKIAKVRLSSGRMVTCYIPGEGTLTVPVRILYHCCVLGGECGMRNREKGEDKREKGAIVANSYRMSGRFDVQDTTSSNTAWFSCAGDAVKIVQA